MALILQADKASEAYVEVLFLWKLYEDGKCWDSMRKVEEELLKLSTKMAKIRALKQQISIYVKGYGLNKYHTAWSSQGTLFSVDYLRTHLIYIITNIRSTG